MSSTRALVAYATEMGSTGEIAGAIGDEIARSGIEVDVRGGEEDRYRN